MFRNIKKTVLVTAVCYGLLYIFYSPQSANFLLAVFILLYVLLYFLKLIFARILYKYSSVLAHKEFVKDNHTLVNAYCVVKYSPGEKLTVQDNLTQKDRREKRVFTVYKYKNSDVDKIWNEICCVFNSYTYFETISAFVAKITPIKIKLVPTTYDASEEKIEAEKTAKNETPITPKKVVSEKPKEEKIKAEPNKQKQKQINKDTEFINMDEIRPDEYGTDNPEISSKDDYFVNMDNIRKVEPKE